MNYYHELTPQPAMVESLLHQWSKIAVEPYPTLLRVEPPDEIPLIKEYLRRAGYRSFHSRFFYSRIGMRVQAHKDSDGRLCAINIPLTIPKQSGLMRWFNQPTWKSIAQVQDGGVYLRMAYHTEEQVIVSDGASVLDAVIRSKAFTKDTPATSELLLTKPTILKVNEWHDVNNEGSDVARMIYSLRFAGNPTFDELIDRFGTIPELT
jgi:hypothetical protein